jgi:Family of unknown function (DUF6932)
MIPPFSADGYLPEGVYDGTMDEAAERFGRFQNSDRRSQLWAKFTEFTGEVKAYGLVETVLVDGSFATSKPDPNDIDIVLVLVANYGFSTDLPATVYNLLAQHRVRRRFGFDIVVVKSDSQSLNDAIDFFQQVKQRPGLKKGILRIKL